MQKRCELPANILASNDSQRVKYLHPVSILIKIGVLVRKKCPKDDYFLAFWKTVSPLVNDEDQAPSGGGGGLEKNE